MRQVRSSTMMRRAGLSFRAKDTNVIILSRIVEMSSSWRSNIAGYVANEFVLCCLLHISRNVESGVGGLLIGFARLSSVPSLMGL